MPGDLTPGTLGRAMPIDPRTPVIVGTGRHTNRPGGEPGGRAEPVDLMVRAVVAAADDCGGGHGGGTGGGGGAIGRRLLGQARSLWVVEPLSWAYLNPGLLVAEALGLVPDELGVSAAGGNDGLRLVHRTALAIGRGELDVAVLAGADCGHSLAAARRHPERPVLPWTVQPADTPRPVRLGSERRPTTDAEEAKGLDTAIHVYPLYENALRAEAGRGLAEHRARLGSLWAGHSRVAAGNPSAWLPEERTGPEIAEPSPANRMVSYPYTKLLSANDQVDQAGALILCSAAAARAAGVPADRWVFPLAGSDTAEHWYLSHRADFRSAPALRLAGRAALSLAGCTVDDVAHVDLHACFPAAAELAAAELGVDVWDAARPATVTGGLTFAGCPGNGYGIQAVATMVETLRNDAGSLGLVSGVGWYLGEHGVGLYGTAPGGASSRAGREDPAGGPHLRVEAVAGFAWADPQQAVSALPQCSPDADARGEVTVETYSVTYNRGGVPTRAVVACRTLGDRRTWATVTDGDQLRLLVDEEGCGRLGTLTGDGTVDLS